MEQTDPTSRPSCLNCGAPLPESARYCPGCGQKNTNGKISVASVLGEVWSNLINLDAKIFRTIPALFIPGKLTREFFRGRHRRYVHPFRIFLLSVFLFLTILVTFTKDGDVGTNDFGRRLERFEDHEKVYKFFEEEKQALLDSFPTTSVQSALDTLDKHLFEDLNLNGPDTIDLTEEMEFVGEPSFKIARRDLAVMELDSILINYQVEGFFNRLLVRQKIKLVRESKSFFRSLVNKISWGVLLMMPFLALILKILYIRRSKYYVEHLIFSFHMHALLFLLGSMALFLGEWVNEAILISVLSVGFPVYLYLSMRYYYGQPWWKTAIKFIFLAFFYLILLIIFIVFTFMLGFLLY